MDTLCFVHRTHLFSNESLRGPNLAFFQLGEGTFDPFFAVRADPDQVFTGTDEVLGELGFNAASRAFHTPGIFLRPFLNRQTGSTVFSSLFHPEFLSRSAA